MLNESASHESPLLCLAQHSPIYGGIIALTAIIVSLILLAALLKAIYRVLLATALAVSYMSFHRRSMRHKNQPFVFRWVPFWRMWRQFLGWRRWYGPTVSNRVGDCFEGIGRGRQFIYGLTVPWSEKKWPADMESDDE